MRKQWLKMGNKIVYEPKYCKDCKHFGSVMSCWHEKNLGHELVTGEREPRVSPYHLRDIDDLCGADGAWYEAEK
jgi:hypothetical protein